MRVLIVEDEERVAAFVKRGLEEEQYRADVARDGLTGIESAISGSYDIILLDVHLPGKNGLDALREMRRKGVNAPVMMLTVRGSVEDKVKALDAGADDYLPKPFAFAELLARLRALTRRNAVPNSPATDILESYDLRMDRIRHRVSRQGRLIDLTATEFNLLEFLLQHPDEVLSRNRIAEEVWGYHFEASTNIVDVYINYLRKKLDQPFSEKLIRTIRGVGYALRKEPASD